MIKKLIVGKRRLSQHCARLQTSTLHKKSTFVAFHCSDIWEIHFSAFKTFPTSTLKYFVPSFPNEIYLDKTFQLNLTYP